jgi:hypothetical protein
MHMPKLTAKERAAIMFAEWKEDPLMNVPEFFERHLREHTARTPRQPKTAFTDGDMAVAKWMWGLILKLQPNRKPPSLDAWANDIRLLREVDGRAYGEIERLYSLVHNDDFWRTNILSPSKLRAKWDDLSLQLPRKTGHGKPEIGRVREREFTTTYGDRYAAPVRPQSPPATAPAARYATG